MKSKFLTFSVAALFAVMFVAGVSAPVSATLVASDTYTQTTVQNQVLACGANTIQIPETVVRGANGSTSTLKTLTVPTELQGKTVTATGQITNNGSVHPGSTINVVSGATSLTLSDVEGSANKVTTATGPLTLAPTVTLTITLGSDGVFSGGGSLSMNIDCPPATPPSPPAAPPQVLSAQVTAPTKVDAGNGGATSSKTSAVLGLVGSLAILGLGLRRLSKHSL